MPVSTENCAVFNPSLHEVAAGDLPSAHICNPLPKLLRRVTILMGNVTQSEREISYDHLVLALGSETNYSGIPGIRDHAMGIRSLGDAIMLRAGVIAMLKIASVESDTERRKRMLTFVVMSGGLAGVETVGAINDLAREPAAVWPDRSA